MFERKVEGLIPGIFPPRPLPPKPGVPIADILKMIEITQGEVRTTMTMCDQLKDRVGHIGWQIDRIKSILEKYR